MENNPLDDLSLEELQSLLSKTISELLKLVEENKDAILIRNKGREIESLQSQIEKRKGSIID